MRRLLLVLGIGCGVLSVGWATKAWLAIADGSSPAFFEAVAFGGVLGILGVLCVSRALDS